MAEKDILIHVRREDSGVPTNDYDILYPKTLERLVVDENGIILKDKMDTKLDKVLYTPEDILTKVKTVDGEGSGLDADTVDGLHAAELAGLAYVNERLNDQPEKYDLALRTGLIKADPYDSYYYANSWGEVTLHAHVKRADGGAITNGTGLFTLPIGWYPAALLSVPAFAAGMGFVGMVDLYSGSGGPGASGVYYGADAPTLSLSASFLAYREVRRGNISIAV
ncbi:hypothetical protein [Gehongia tenuis]|uniref:Uncharacterized protein n=1 Tax=Gehongia tenuis TaxID=2763655 RepID=A0A926HL75_9FIRM|nr:hypothetical protein [Gehongia tenuis]MBC8531767.1 hypothetical protein [Gehongia tenuis]